MKVLNTERSINKVRSNPWVQYMRD